jgi:hypothetical protein
MYVSSAIESLRRFPQDAELLYDGREISVVLFGYASDSESPHTPMYNLYAEDKDLPWLTDPSWLDNHKIT